MGRAPCCDKANVKKGPWSPEEDAKLKSYIEQHGTGGNWIALPQKIGLRRCGKSCRLRWLNYLRPNIKHGGFSEEEDNIICSLYISIGSRWSIIAAQLPGRTDNDIKNYWNTRLKKKLLGKQRKEKHARGREPAKQNSGEVSGGFMGQLTAAQLPVLPHIPYSNDEPRFNDHSSIRNLLMKLGGRFSAEDQADEQQIKLQYPAINGESLIQPAYSLPIDYISSSDQIPFLETTSSMANVPHFDMVGADLSTMLPEPSINLAEFERKMYENPQKLQGLEFFYDDFMNSGTISGESMEMNSLSFAASASNNNQGFLQESSMEELAVNKMRYPGTQ